jgi:L-aspartate oxidase
MAYRAGARVINMEFVQFHPTTFYHPQAQTFLISEAVRGAGARLVNAKGEPFMQKYEPEWQDLAPRDIVARSIQREMTAQGTPNVYLDLRSYIPAQAIRAHFPTIYEYCLSYGVDITRDLVPVAPAAHYACGGISVNEWGQTTIKGLYAVGEVSCTGLHGANRLASTSLLEGLVWGNRAAEKIRAGLRIQAHFKRAADVLPYESYGCEVPSPPEINPMMTMIREFMWDYVGLIRVASGLEYALHKLRYLEADIEALYRRSRLSDELIGLRNMAQVGRLITTAALENKMSLGCHYRATEREENSLFQWAFMQYNGKDGYGRAPQEDCKDIANGQPTHDRHRIGQPLRC